MNRNLQAMGLTALYFCRAWFFLSLFLPADVYFFIESPFRVSDFCFLVSVFFSRPPRCQMVSFIEEFPALSSSNSAQVFCVTAIWIIFAVRSPPAILRSAMMGTIGNCTNRLKRVHLSNKQCPHLLAYRVTAVRVSWKQPLKCGDIWSPSRRAREVSRMLALQLVCTGLSRVLRQGQESAVMMTLEFWGRGNANVAACVIFAPLHRHHT